MGGVAAVSAVSATVTAASPASERVGLKTGCMMFLLGSVVGTRLSSRSEHLGSRLSQQRIHPQLAVWFAKSSDSALKWQSLEGADPPSGAIRGDGQGYHCAMEITSFDIAFRGG
jgi:hypothetical protein